tara:strand:- start:213 stop:530 length:318 start_codon:yes stop_codon:yes gene_type:complete
VGKLKNFIPTNVTTYINHAIKVNIALKIRLAVNIDCMLRPDIRAKDKKTRPIPNILNTILYPFSTGNISLLVISPFFIFLTFLSRIIISLYAINRNNKLKPVTIK